LLVPWSYRKVIKEASQAGNVVVFHSSELPKSRGWAPIYHAFSEQDPEYVISGIFAVDEVDAGDIIVRARFPIKADYTAPFMRAVDTEISLLLIAKILAAWPRGKPVGVQQKGEPVYRSRRSPADNEIDPSLTVSELLPHLRGVEPSTPAFFYYRDTKYLIEVRPENTPKKPEEVTIEYPALNMTEVWRGWNDSA
jgi:methionyl-tRNA formyltransferase